MPGVRKSFSCLLQQCITLKHYFSFLTSSCSQNLPQTQRSHANTNNSKAPDALQQVKRSIRNLFSRKRKNQDQQKLAEGSTSSKPVPTITTAGELTHTGTTNPFLYHIITFQLILPKSETAPLPQPSTAVIPPESEVPTQSPQPQIPVPPKGAADVNKTQETLPSTAQTPTSDSAPNPGRAGEPGMSATSGPLDDQMVHEYSDVETDEAPAPVAKKSVSAEAATAVERPTIKA